MKDNPEDVDDCADVEETESISNRVRVNDNKTFSNLQKHHSPRQWTLEDNWLAREQSQGTKLAVRANSFSFYRIEHMNYVNLAGPFFEP